MSMLLLQALVNSLAVSYQWLYLTVFVCVIGLQWFTFRDVYMSHVDKTEDHVSKLHREYQDHWNKYAEALDRGEDTVKVRQKYVYCLMYSSCVYVVCDMYVLFPVLSWHGIIHVSVCVCVCLAL